MGLDVFSLQNKHIVIVGASSGLGRATALACAEVGANVSICARREDKLQEVTAELNGDNHGYATVDVKDLASIDAGFDKFVKERGRIDGMVYCAGISPVRPLSVIDEKFYNNIMDINLKGAVFCSKAVLKNTRSIKQGTSLVFMSSINSYNTIGKGMIAYSASKAAINGMVRAMALDISARGHRSNALIIGGIQTDIWNREGLTEPQTNRFIELPQLGPGDESDVANACIYLLSSASKWVTGATLLIDGGSTLTE